MSNEPKTRFTGIFIPAEILEIQELTLFEMILLSWIDALYCPEHGGCFASNEYLGEKIRGAQVNTVAKALTKLRSMGLIEDVSFDGRKRVIRALINRHVDKAQSKSALDLNPRGVGQKSNPSLDKNPSPPYIYSKDEKQEREPPTPQRGKSASADCVSSFVLHGKFVKLKVIDYETLCREYGKTVIDSLIQDMNNYCLASNPKGYKNYLAALENWLKKNKTPVLTLEDEGCQVDPILEKILQKRNNHGA